VEIIDMRTINIEVLRDEVLFEAEIYCKLPLRVAFMGLLLYADKKGRFVWKPSRIKLDVLPYDSVDMFDVLEELFFYKIIQKYTDGSEIYGHISDWEKYQAENDIEIESELPSPEECKYMEEDVKIKEPKISDHEEVLQYLIDKTGTNFKFVNSNFKPIVSILKDKGITVDICKKVIDLKCSEWLHNELMSNNLKPSTLFRRCRFYEYIAFIEKPQQKVKTSSDRILEMIKK
jgi:uncharacterized phage protein (TIGR02220 family)